MKLCIVGYGSFGSALSGVWCDKFDEISAWRFREVKKLEEGCVQKIQFCSSIYEAVKDVDVILISTASIGVDDVVHHIKQAGLKDGQIILTATKGIDVKTQRTMSEIVKDNIPNARVAVFSGPTFSHEIKEGLPVFSTIASESNEVLDFLYDLLSIPKKMILYKSNDVKGVELIGALKNVVVVLSGFMDSIKLGISAKGAVISLFFAELVNICYSLGANPETLLGISGVGDLLTSCSSDLGRNYKYGYMIGMGFSMDDIIIKIGKVTEGIKTLEAAYIIKNKLNLFSPILDGLYNLVYNSVDVHEFINDSVLASFC